MTCGKQPSFQGKPSNARRTSRINSAVATQMLRPWCKACGPRVSRFGSRDVVTRKEFSDLGEQFEDKEHEQFGNEGFDGIVIQVGEIERALGIFDLDQFTPA